MKTANFVVLRIGESSETPVAELFFSLDAIGVAVANTDDVRYQHNNGEDALEDLRAGVFVRPKRAKLGVWIPVVGPMEEHFNMVRKLTNAWADSFAPTPLNPCPPC